MRPPFPRSPRLPFFVGGVVVALSAPSAQAFCRTRTCEFDRTVPFDEACRPDQGLCATVGVLTYWDRPCLGYTVQKDGSATQGISATELEALVAAGFQEWTNARCADGQTPRISVFDRGLIACDAVEYNCTEGVDNNNIILFRDAESELDAFTVGLSTVTAYTDTGEIVDVDIEINSFDNDLTLDGSFGRDLRVVINHELGHFLGIAHTSDQGALMRNTYGDTPELRQDDINAICAAFPHGATDPECDIEPLDPLAPDAGCVGRFRDCLKKVSTGSVRDHDGEGCGCTLPGQASSTSPSAPWLLVGAAVLWRRVRLRRAFVSTTRR